MIDNAVEIIVAALVGVNVLFLFILTWRQYAVEKHLKKEGGDALNTNPSENEDVKKTSL
ncbi:hypothetical protein DSECCO2_509690 [anaerobic digester metagenome]|jgi:hypothetical protein